MPFFKGVFDDSYDSLYGLHVLFNNIVCNARELLKLVSSPNDILTLKHLAKYENDINKALREGAKGLLLEVKSILKSVFSTQPLLSQGSRLLAALFAIFEINVETEKLKVKFESPTGNMTTTIELPLLIEVGNDSKNLEQIKKVVVQLCNGINQIYPRVWGGDVAFSKENGKTVFDLIPENDKKRLKELLVSKEPEKIVSNSFN